MPVASHISRSAAWVTGCQKRLEATELRTQAAIGKVARRTIMDTHRDDTATSIRPLTTVPWRMYLLIGAIGIIVMGMVGYGFYTGDRMNTLYAPLIDAAMEIKLQATTAHLWFEEIISNDRHESLAVAWEHLEQAERNDDE